MASAMWRYILKTTWLLTVFCIVGTGAVALTYSITYEQVAANARLTLLNRLNALIPPSQRDNDIDQDTVQLTAPDYLGSHKPTTIYRARMRGQPVAAIFEVVAPDGYSGAINLLVAIHYEGVVAGVRVLSHKETPGLGDYIEEGRSTWIFNFDGHSLADPNPAGWHVKKDGGIFDQVTGATITPRAVVKAVFKCLQYFNANRQQIFATSNVAPTTEAVKHG